MAEHKKNGTFSDLPLRPFSMRNHYRPYIYKRTKSHRLELLKEKMKSN